MPNKRKHKAATQAAPPPKAVMPTLTPSALRNKALDGHDGTRLKSLRRLESLARHQETMRRLLTAAHALPTWFKQWLPAVHFLREELTDVSLQLVTRNVTQAVLKKCGLPADCDSSDILSKVTHWAKVVSDLAEQMEAHTKELRVECPDIPQSDPRAQPALTTEQLARIHRKNAGQEVEEDNAEGEVFSGPKGDLAPLFLFVSSRDLLLTLTDAFKRRDADFFKAVAVLLDREHPTDPLNWPKLAFVELTENTEGSLLAPDVLKTLKNEAVGATSELHTVRRSLRAIGKAGKTGRPKGRRNSQSAPHRPGKKR